MFKESTLFTKLRKPPDWMSKVEWFDKVPDFKRSAALIKLAKVDEVGNAYGKIGDFWFIFHLSAKGRVSVECIDEDLFSVFHALIGRMEFKVSESSYCFLDRKISSMVYQSYEIILKYNQPMAEILKKKLQRAVS